MTFSHRGLTYAEQPIPRFGLTLDHGHYTGVVWLWWRPLLSWCFDRSDGTWWVKVWGDYGLRLCAPWYEEWVEDPVYSMAEVSPIERWRLGRFPCPPPTRKLLHESMYHGVGRPTDDDDIPF
jgi:hypothetical protein